MIVKPVRAIKIFFCYAHEDETLREQLARHLSPLRRLKYITAWFDRDIQAGTDWEHEIETHLDTASIILLLVSADFIASDYCYTIEMQRALDRHQTGTAHVIPIILRPVHWEDTPIGALQALPPGTKPVTQWADRDEAWLNVVQGIREVVKTLLPKQILSSQETTLLYPEQVGQQIQHPAVLSPQIPSPHPPSLSSSPTPNPATGLGNGLICPKCGFENRPGSKFCQQDRQPLTSSATHKPTPPLPSVQGNSIQPASPTLSISQIALSPPVSVSVTTPSFSLRKALSDLPSQYLKVLTKFSTTTFEKEMGKARWRIVWLQFAGSSVLVGIFLMLVGLIIFFVHAVPQDSWWSFPLQTLLIGCSLNLALLLLSLIGMGITYLIAKAYGGRGLLLSQSYTMYLFQIPTLSASTIIISFWIILGILGVDIWYINLLNILMLIIVFCYNIVLGTFSIMATHQLNRDRATKATFISMLIMPVILIFFFISHHLVDLVASILVFAMLFWLVSSLASRRI